MRFLRSNNWRTWVVFMTALGTLVSGENQVLTPLSKNVEFDGTSLTLAKNGDTLVYQVVQENRDVPFRKVIIQATTGAPAWNITLNGVTSLISAATLQSGYEAPLLPNVGNPLEITFPATGIEAGRTLVISSVTASTDAIGAAPSITTAVLTRTSASLTTPLATTRPLALPTFTGTFPEDTSLTDGVPPTIRPPPAATYTNIPPGLPTLATTSANGGRIAGAILGSLFGAAGLLLLGCFVRRRRARGKNIAYSNAYTRNASSSDPYPRFNGERRGSGSAYANNYYGNSGDNSAMVAGSPLYPGSTQRNVGKIGMTSVGAISPIVEERIHDPFQNPTMHDGPFPTFSPSPLSRSIIVPERASVGMIGPPSAEPRDVARMV